MSEPKKRVRPLSLRAANRCETAEGPICRCRCLGTRHGAKRLQGLMAETGETAEGISREALDGWFQALPEDDPHHRPVRSADAWAKQERKRQNAARWYARSKDGLIPPKGAK